MPSRQVLLTRLAHLNSCSNNLADKNHLFKWTDDKWYFPLISLYGLDLSLLSSSFPNWGLFGWQHPNKQQTMYLGLGAFLPSFNNLKTNPFQEPLTSIPSYKHGCTGPVESKCNLYAYMRLDLIPKLAGAGASRWRALITAALSGWWPQERATKWWLTEDWSGCKACNRFCITIVVSWLIKVFVWMLVAFGCSRSSTLAFHRQQVKICSCMLCFTSLHGSSIPASCLFSCLTDAGGRLWNVVGKFWVLTDLNWTAGDFKKLIEAFWLVIQSSTRFGFLAFFGIVKP